MSEKMYGKKPCSKNDLDVARAIASLKAQQSDPEEAFFAGIAAEEDEYSPEADAKKNDIDVEAVLAAMRDFNVEEAFLTETEELPQSLGADIDTDIAIGILHAQAPKTDKEFCDSFPASNV